MLLFIDLVACVTLFLIRHADPLKWFLFSRKEDLLQWYPRLGLFVFYALKSLVYLQIILLSVAIAGMLYFLIYAIRSALQKFAMINSETKRLHKFTILSVLLFSLLVILLIYIFTRVTHTGDVTAINNNDAINQRNLIYSRGNSFGFTDKERKTDKPKGVFRIAVLGDSFIWGDGLPYDMVWSHKLEKKLLRDYDSIEVIHWGKNGWSTLDEFNFFKEHGKDYDIDMIIVGWVDNDPDIGTIPHVVPGNAAKEFPLLYKINQPLANVMQCFKKNYEYKDWLSQLYGDKNLEDYQHVLCAFQQYIAQRNIKLLFVMTPGSEFGNNTKKHFDLVRPMFTKANLAYLDLFDPVKKRLAHYSPQELLANPANGHPGELMTEEFAAEVMDYIVKNSYLQGVPKRGTLKE